MSSTGDCCDEAVFACWIGMKDIFAYLKKKDNIMCPFPTQEEVVLAVRLGHQSGDVNRHVIYVPEPRPLPALFRLHMSRTAPHARARENEGDAISWEAQPRTSFKMYVYDLCLWYCTSLSFVAHCIYFVDSYSDLSTYFIRTIIWYTSIYIEDMLQNFIKKGYNSTTV